MPLPKTRTYIRRFSPCNRHPTEPATGICPLCLRDRLAGLDSSNPSHQIHTQKTNNNNNNNNDRGYGVVSPSPEFRRSKSEKRDVGYDLVVDQTRRSCDVMGCHTLYDLFVIDDDTKKLMNLGVSDDVIDDDGVVEGDVKTMKEMIEIELKNKRRSLIDAASDFSKRLRKWREKIKEKKQVRRRSGKDWGFKDTHQCEEVVDYGIGRRRSCDTEPRFSIDGSRLSVDGPRFSLDERRGSCDGYVGRMVPRVTPMMRYSTSRKMEGFGGEDGRTASNARVSPASDVVFEGTKLVITEKELKEWHLNSLKNSNVESVSDAPNSSSETSVTNQSNEQKKKVVSSRWRKVCNLWGNKHKLGDNKNHEHIPEANVKPVINSSSLYTRNTRDEDLLDRNRSTRYSTSDIDTGLLRLHWTPFRNSRRNKTGKSKAQSMATNGFQLY